MGSTEVCGASTQTSGMKKTLSSVFFHSCGHGRVPANMYDENYALLRAAGALASLQPFGIRSFCAKSARKTASSSCLDARQMCASVCASTRLRPLGSLFIHTYLPSRTNHLFFLRESSLIRISIRRIPSAAAETYIPSRRKGI